MITFPKKKGRKSKKELQQIASLKMQQELLDDETLTSEEKENKILELKQNLIISNNDLDIKKIPKKEVENLKVVKSLKLKIILIIKL